jgi:hypothetical protein
MSELSFGEKACGVSFNPGGNPVVDSIKRNFANIVDELEALRQQSAKERPQDVEVRRMLSIAITDAQTAQMWAVKAVTWSH